MFYLFFKQLIFKKYNLFNIISTGCKKKKNAFVTNLLLLYNFKFFCELNNCKKKKLEYICQND